MIRFSKIAAALAVVPVMAFATPALADSPGQLEGGNVYVVKNLTQGGSYSTTINTACNDEVQYSIRLHNIAFGGLTNIKVSANLISGQMTATPDQGADWGTTASVKVNLPANGSLNVEADTTNLYNSSGSVIKTLPNGITTSGVNAGDLNGSTTEFVIFKAKVACTKQFTVTAAPTTPAPTKATSLPNTGAGDVVGLFAGASAAGTAAHAIVTRRKRGL
jgi:hypothetical protein